MAYYLIRIQAISEDGWDLAASTKTDHWFDKLIKESIPESIKKYEGTLSVRISKVGRTIELLGGAYIKMAVACDRCTEEFESEQQVPFRLILEPAKRDKDVESAKEEETEELDEALDFSYYSGEDIDIGDLIRQHIVMAQPIQHFCDENCKGLCPQCGKNLNEGPCGCESTPKESPFAVLKKLRK